METTMIQVKKETTEKLKQFKAYNRQSYDEIINQLMEDSDSEVLTDADVNEIKQGLDDIRAGRTRSIEAVAKDMGIKLK